VSKPKELKKYMQRPNFRRKIRFFGRVVPIWAFLMIGIVSAAAVIVIVIQKPVREEVTVVDVGLVFTGIDVTVIGASVTISYDVYEDGLFSATTAYSIFNDNSQGLDIWLIPQNPTGTYDQMQSYTASIDGVEFLSYDGTVWTTTAYGILNGATGIVSIDMAVGVGTTPIIIDQLYTLELVTAAPALGTFDWECYDYPEGFSASFTGTSLGGGDPSWIGLSTLGYTIDEVIAERAADNITSTVITGDPFCEYGGTADFTAADVGNVAQILQFHLHIAETDEYVTVPPYVPP